MSIFFAVVVVMSAQSDVSPRADAGGSAQPPATADAPASEGVAPESNSSAPATGDAPPVPASPPPTTSVPAQGAAPKSAPEIWTPAPEAPPQTRWQPLDEEVESMASGMLGVCETLILPISIIPAVGEYIGLAAEWACIVPAGFAVQHTALHHGDRAPHLWQIFIALGVQKLWQTIVALPVPFVLVTAAIVGGLLGAVGTALGLPVGISLGLIIAPLTLTYLVSDILEDEGGRFIFTRMYDLFDDAVRNDEHAQAARTSWVGPRQDGTPGVIYLVATAQGSDAPFELPFLIPVLGPLIKSRSEAATTKERMERAGVEVLGERKHDLTGMESVIDFMANTEGYLMAIGQAGLLTSFSMLGVSLILWNNDSPDGAEVFGTLGALGAILAAGFVGAAKLPDAVKPCCVPGAYMLAPVVEKYPDPRSVEIPPPPRKPPLAPAAAPTTSPTPAPTTPRHEQTPPPEAAPAEGALPSPPSPPPS